MLILLIGFITTSIHKHVVTHVSNVEFRYIIFELKVVKSVYIYMYMLYHPCEGYNPNGGGIMNLFPVLSQTVHAHQM